MKDLKISDGTYEHCTKCKLKKNCCCDFEDVIIFEFAGRKQIDLLFYYIPINRE